MVAPEVEECKPLTAKPVAATPCDAGVCDEAESETEVGERIQLASVPACLYRSRPPYAELLSSSQQ
jgi:hypothetical protein